MSDGFYYYDVLAPEMSNFLMTGVPEREAVYPGADPYEAAEAYKQAREWYIDRSVVKGEYPEEQIVIPKGYLEGGSRYIFPPIGMPGGPIEVEGDPTSVATYDDLASGDLGIDGMSLVEQYRGMLGYRRGAPPLKPNGHKEEEDDFTYQPPPSPDPFDDEDPTPDPDPYPEPDDEPEPRTTTTVTEEGDVTNIYEGDTVNYYTGQEAETVREAGNDSLMGSMFPMMMMFMLLMPMLQQGGARPQQLAYSEPRPRDVSRWFYE